jgi:GntR family transcriptional regulator
LLKVPFTGTGEAVEFTSSYYRGDAYDFVAELTISQPDRIQSDDV